MERKIDLSDYTWTEDDDIPGQIKFIFQIPELLGKASVRLYLNDGYDAPKETAEEKNRCPFGRIQGNDTKISDEFRKYLPDTESN